MWPHELKLQRAKEHFEKLKTEVWRWEEGEGYALSMYPDSHPPHYVLRAEVVEPITEDPFSFLIGDFLQNARAALDYLACALGDAGAGGFMSEDVATETMFPIIGGTDPDGVTYGGSKAFPQRARRRLATVPDPARAVIESLQPYKTGRDLWYAEPFWVLNELARFDRHRFLHLAIARAGNLMPSDKCRNVRITDLDVETGNLTLLEGMALEDKEVFGGDEDRAMLARFTAEPINPGEEMDVDFESALEIIFDVDRLPPSCWRGLDGQSLVWALWYIPGEIEKAFNALAPFLPDEPPW